MAAKKVGDSRRRRRGSLAHSLLRGSAPVAGRCPRADAPHTAAAPTRRNAPRVTRSARTSRSSRARCAKRRVKVTAPGRNATHYPGWPLQHQGRYLRSRRRGDGRKRPPLTLEPSASPAGLTARARPKARPRTRAANLSLSPGLGPYAGRPGSWNSAVTCDPSIRPRPGPRSSATTVSPHPDHQEGRPGRRLGRSEQRRDRLHADEFVLVKPRGGTVHRAALLHPGRHRSRQP